jgi:protein O-GlcNAc transferase
MRLLKRVAGSVLWLAEPEPVACANLRAEAEARGIDATRIVFAPRLPLAEHRARQRAADLFLDTPTFNAHTTASDALWVGLPVLTCAGASFSSRLAASVLRAAGLPELVSASLAEYEQCAFALATDAPRLAALRTRLAQQRATLPLFDTSRFVRDLEAAYSAIWARRVAGLPDADLQVRDDPRGDIGVVEDAPVPEPARGVQPSRGQ